MELEHIVMVVLILIIVYMLLQMSQQQKSQSDRVVYLQSPYIGYGFGAGPLWRGPRPGGRRRRRRRFWF